MRPIGENRMNTMFLKNCIFFVSTFLFISCQNDSAKTSTQKSSNSKETAQSNLTLLEKSLKKNPSYENYINYGLELSKLTRHEEAIKAFEKSRNLFPKGALAHNNLCAEYNSLKRWTLAIQNCEKALKLQPNFVLAKNNYSFAIKEKATQDSRIQKLLSNLRKVKNEEKNNLIIDIGHQYYLQGNYREAIKQWEQVPQQSTKHFLALNNIGTARILQKKFTMAKKVLVKAQNLQPNNQLIKNNLNWLESELKSQ